MIRRMFMATVLAITTAAAGLAATQATLILRNGERHSGTLVYKKDANFNLLENGQDRSWPQSEVAVIEIAGGTPSADEIGKLPRGGGELERNMVALRDGSTVTGKLYNINENDSITIDTNSGGRRDISFSDISRIYINPGAARSVFRSVTRPGTPAATTGTTSTPSVPGAVMVAANRQWNDTNLTVKRGDRVVFQASGTVKWGEGAEQTANADGSNLPSAPKGPQLPISTMPVGGLIARVGNGAPFPIGSNSAPVAMPTDGRLSLGINDDNFGDNSGAFAVVVTLQPRRR